MDYDDNFSPTPGIALARIMVSLVTTNNLELHSVDIEQAFTKADKLPGGVNGRYFINPPSGIPDSGNRDIVYEVLSPLYGNPSSPRVLHKTMNAFFKSEGFDTIGRDCPEVVDPNVHRRYHSIVGCLSYLVNITRPDLAFNYSQFK